MNITLRFISLLTALSFVLISGCATVSRESTAPMERQDRSESRTQEREHMTPSPSVKGEMEEVNQQQKSKGSDDMERLD